MFFLLKTLIDRRKFIFGVTILITIVTAGVTLLLPEWYKARTLIFPPKQGPGYAVYRDLEKSVRMTPVGPTSSTGRPETISIVMMKSRHIGEKLVKEFDLYGVYDVALVEDALAELRSRTGYTLLENGLIEVTFEDRDPVRAAAIANRYIELLDEFNREITATKASRTREFVEEQLREHEQALSDAETALKQFRQAHEALELDEQLRAAMLIVIGLTADAIALETELRILEQYAAPESEEYLQKKREYDTALEQLKALKLDHNRDEKDLLHAYLPALEKIPDMAVQLLRLEKGVEIETAVCDMLLTELAKARVEEMRDKPTVQVIDRAAVPTRHHRPQRRIIIPAGATVGLGWSVYIALLAAFWRRKRNS